MKRAIIFLAGAALLASPAAAVPGTRVLDGAAIDQLIRDTYAVISGPAGKKRDVEQMRRQFAPDAMLRAIGPDGLRGGSNEDYIAKSVPIMEKEGFAEVELGRRVEIYGNLASVWSAYEGRNDDGSYHERGVNSFQLVKLNGKWVVASLIWQEETPDNQIPADLIAKGEAK